MGEGAHSEITVGPLPQSPIDAHAEFVEEALGQVREAVAVDAVEAITILLQPEGPDHDDWRRAVARDLARAVTPKRVNIAAGVPGEALDTLIAFLKDAPGVTGHYLQTHE